LLKSLLLGGDPVWARLSLGDVAQLAVTVYLSLPGLKTDGVQLRIAASSRSSVRQSELLKFVEAGSTLPDMIENGAGHKRVGLACQTCQSRPPWTADSFWVGMFCVHKTIKCGDQIVEIFLSVHDKPLE
jgi:hypothetical protein